VRDAERPAQTGKIMFVVIDRREWRQPMRKIVANVSKSILDSFDERGYHVKCWMPAVVKFPKGKPREAGLPCVVVMNKEDRWYQNHRGLEKLEKPEKPKGEKLVVRIYPTSNPKPAKFELTCLELKGGEILDAEVLATGSPTRADERGILYCLALRTPTTRAKAVAQKFLEFKEFKEVRNVK
jgi:hypothetical protein